MSSLDLHKLQTLLQQTKTIIQNHKEMAALRGENFNVFSILNMERRENETHSAFIEELLNPQGSHLMGNLFLRLFLEQIKYGAKDGFDLESAETKVEHYIAKVDNENREGGRIDILIKDKNNVTISIENKIDAGDQEFQIERYTNFNKGKNTVYYLTKYGTPASDYSSGKLKDGEGYFCISYKETVSEWLEKCLKEASKHPILRESIRQYIILVQKITNSMDDKQEKQLNELMLSNFAEAEYIASNFESLKNEIKEIMRQEVIKELTEQITKLGRGIILQCGSKITNTFAQIWFVQEDGKLIYGAESFSGTGHHGGDLFVGVHKGNIEGYIANTDDSVHWKKTTFILNQESKRINFSDPNLLSRLYRDKKYQKELVELIATQIMKFIKETPIS